MPEVKTTTDFDKFWSDYKNTMLSGYGDREKAVRVWEAAQAALLYNMSIEHLHCPRCDHEFEHENIMPAREEPKWVLCTTRLPAPETNRRWVVRKKPSGQLEVVATAVLRQYTNQYDQWLDAPIPETLIDEAEVAFQFWYGNSFKTTNSMTEEDARIAYLAGRKSKT